MTSSPPIEEKQGPPSFAPTSIWGGTVVKIHDFLLIVVSSVATQDHEYS